MSDLSISIRDNGPYLITVPVTVVDSTGNPYEAREVTALCRCGHSANKPFCDGSHNAQAFKSEPRA